MGTVPLDMICISESGEIVHQLFVRRDEYKGRLVWFGFFTALQHKKGH
jgi:hypothetical protein